MISLGYFISHAISQRSYVAHLRMSTKQVVRVFPGLCFIHHVVSVGSSLSPWVIKAEIKFPNLLGLPLRPLHTVFTDFKTQLLQSGFRFFAELVIVMPTSGSGKYPYFMCLVFSQDTDIFTGLQSCSGSLRSSPTLSFYRLGIWGPEWFRSSRRGDAPRQTMV